MKPRSLFIQILAGALALLVEGAINYKVYPINQIDTVWGALVVAFSFWPGMLIAYASIGIQRWAGEKEPDVPAAAAICAMLWFIYLFRALTLAIGLPMLSNWTQWPVDVLVNFFESLDHLFT
jgi:hypothetical protein